MSPKEKKADVAPFIISREFDAPRALVWKALTDPEEMQQWFGPKGFTGRAVKMDFHPGGIYHYYLRSPDGNEMWGKCVYREIVPMEKIVFINSFSDEKGGLARHPMNPNWPIELLSTYTLTEKDGKITFTITWEPYNSNSEEIKTFDNGRESMKGGWTGTLDRLTDYHNRQPIVMERTYNAPVEKVWKALTDKGQMKEWYFDLPMFKPEVGCEFQFSAGKDDKKYLHLCKVTEVIATKKITYSWRYDGYEGNSFVTFELFAEGKQTKLVLTHKGLETFPKSNPDLAKKNFIAGWTFILGTSLKNFMEKS